MSPRFVRSLPRLGGTSGRVVVCDDSDELRALLVSRLAKQEGLEVVGDVADGVAALEAVTELHPDVLLLDLMIDETDPDELLQALAAVDARPLVIVFSGLSPSELQSESRAVIDLFLDKTTPLRLVAERVEEEVVAHRARESR